MSDQAEQTTARKSFSRRDIVISWALFLALVGVAIFLLTLLVPPLAAFVRDSAPYQVIAGLIERGWHDVRGLPVSFRSGDWWGIIKVVGGVVLVGSFGVWTVQAIQRSRRPRI
jgi:hypothetical protein